MGALMIALSRRLAESKPLVLDGATGTELARRGFPLSLPLWSASAILEAPDTLRDIHADYVEAGAELVTANTFRTHERSLAKGGMPGRAAELTCAAVEIARECTGGWAWLLGSQAPLEDCYRPDLVPDDSTLAREHALHAGNLAKADVDAILVETQNTVREAVAATKAAAATGLPVLVSFLCGADGKLLSGETVTAAAQAVLPFKPVALMINCAPTPTLITPLKELLAAAPVLHIGGYGNTGHAGPDGEWVSDGMEDPAAYAAHADTWLKAGARIVGGCCGTTPQHVRALANLIKRG